MGKDDRGEASLKIYEIRVYEETHLIYTSSRKDVGPAAALNNSKHLFDLFKNATRIQTDYNGETLTQYRPGARIAELINK